MKKITFDLIEDLNNYPIPIIEELNDLIVSPKFFYAYKKNIPILKNISQESARAIYIQYRDEIIEYFSDAYDLTRVAFENDMEYILQDLNNYISNIDENKLFDPSILKFYQEHCMNIAILQSHTDDIADRSDIKIDYINNNISYDLLNQAYDTKANIIECNSSIFDIIKNSVNTLDYTHIEPYDVTAGQASIINLLDTALNYEELNNENISNILFINTYFTCFDNNANINILFDIISRCGDIEKVIVTKEELAIISPSIQALDNLIDLRNKFSILSDEEASKFDNIDNKTTKEILMTINNFCFSYNNLSLDDTIDKIYSICNIKNDIVQKDSAYANLINKALEIKFNNKNKTIKEEENEHTK